MSETGGTPKPPPGKSRKLPHAIHTAGYFLLGAVGIAMALGAGLLNLPKWPAMIAVTLVVALGIWALEYTPLNPNRDLERDPFGRKFPTIIRHWLRARSLRSKQIEWRWANRQDLPPVVVEILHKHAGNDPEVTATIDGLLWVSAECDDWDNIEPPTYSVMAFDSAGQMQALDDFLRWPKDWAVPSGSQLGRKIPLIRWSR